MHAIHARGSRAPVPLAERLAGAPISWGAGRGDARIAEVLNALQGHGYDGWLVLEQDTAITGDEPTVAGGPMRDARESIAFVHHSARTTEEINR